MSACTPGDTRTAARGRRASRCRSRTATSSRTGAFSRRPPASARDTLGSTGDASSHRSFDRVSRSPTYPARGSPLHVALSPVTTRAGLSLAHSVRVDAPSPAGKDGRLCRSSRASVRRGSRTTRAYAPDEPRRARRPRHHHRGVRDGRSAHPPRVLRRGVGGGRPRAVFPSGRVRRRHRLRVQPGAPQVHQDRRHILLAGSLLTPPAPRSPRVDPAVP